MHLNRLDRDYGPLLGMCRLLVEGYAPGMELGEVEQLAFVFDMSVLFEEFVAEFLRRHRESIVLEDGGRIAKVERQRVLGKLFDEFDMKVDLVLEDDRGKRFLVDTKYKVLDSRKDHAGLSQADFYQMYGYARAGRETFREIFLLYPVGEVPVEEDFCQEEDLTLRVRQFDPRRIYDPVTGSPNIDDTVEELGRALSGCT